MPNQLQTNFGTNFAILGESRFSRFSVPPYEPELVAAMALGSYRKNKVGTSFDGLITHARAGGATYVDATGTIQTAAANVPRIGHHVWDGTSWVNQGLLLESEARTQLLHETDAMPTQTETVTAQPYTLHFTGTGTVTLSGASTAGPLVGTGTGEENRVSLTFTPTAGTLTLTVSGTVTNAQLEAGSTPSSYIPNLAASGSVTRAAETLTIPAANLPWPEPRVIGPELVTNGTFDTDTDWTDISSGSGTSIISGGTLTVTSGDPRSGNVGAASQTITGLSVGSVYALSIQNTGSNEGIIAVSNGDLGFTDVPTGETTEVYFVATGTSRTLFIYSPIAANGIAIYDNVSVREIDPLAVSISMSGLVTYADTDQGAEVRLIQWQEDTSNRILTQISTSGTDTGQVEFFQFSGGVSDTVQSSGSSYSPGINVPFSIASRHGSTFINGAVDGVALTENTTPVALPDLSATDLDLGPTFMGTIKTFRMWGQDIGNTGIAEASE